jgi:lipoate-protein ligase A
MRDHNVALARRPTGGGAVYQDLGNSCWTFLGPEFDPQSNNAILIDALSRLGIQASPTGRNDLEVANRKVSGAAFRRTPFRSIHHGTLLRDVNMDMLAQCLTVDPAKLKAKGVPSVRSRVLNLCERWPELTHDAFCRELIDAFQRKHGQVRVEKIGEHEMLDNSDVKKTFGELSARDWLFGTWSDSAPFSASKKFDFGLFEVSARVDNGKVTECAVNTDCLSTDVVELFKAIVIGGTPTNHLRSDAEREMLSQLTTWFLPQIHLTRS